MATGNSPARLVIGVTGGIGSGKSAATAFFAEAGIVVVDADVVAREVVEPGTPALTEIGKHFGSDTLQADGSLDRKALRAIIFSNPIEKQWLESLLHPLIRAEIERQLQDSTSPYTILSSPLLLETNQNEMVDRVLVIDAPEQQQISRTSARDDTNIEAVQAIMATQLSRQQRLQKADDVIVNDSDLDSLKSNVMELHKKYCLMVDA